MMDQFLSWSRIKESSDLLDTRVEMEEKRRKSEDDPVSL